MMLSVVKTTTLKTYQQVAIYLLRTNGTDGNTAETENVISIFSKPSNKTPSQYAEELMAKAFRCGDKYEEHNLKEIFIQGLDTSIQQNMRGYWASEKSNSSRFSFPCYVVTEIATGTKWACK